MWRGMVSVQDNWERLRLDAEKALIEMQTGLNPIFNMKELRQGHAMARTKDYIPEERNAKQRVALVQKKGM